MQKTVVWNDGTTETVMVDSVGKVFLNGKETVAFGFNIHEFPYWYAYNAETMGISDKELGWLQQHGVRFICLSMPSWRTEESHYRELLDWWLPKLYAHKMWTLFCVQESPTDNIDPDAQLNRIQAIVNCITEKKYANMIYGFGISWEIDNYAYSDAETEAYLNNLKPRVFGFLRGSLIGEVPLIAKNSATISDHGTIPTVKYSDVPSWDFYTSSVPDDRINLFINSTLPQALKPANMKFWFTESGNASGDYTPEMFQWLLNPYGYGRVSSLLIWILEAPPEWNYTANAFDANGDPMPWLLNLVPYFPKMPAPSGCFIATACYGSPTNLRVCQLRKLKDAYVARSRTASLLYRLYYVFSPSIANFIRERENLKKPVRKVIEWLAKKM